MTIYLQMSGTESEPVVCFSYCYVTQAHQIALLKTLFHQQADNCNASKKKKKKKERQEKKKKEISLAANVRVWVLICLFALTILITCTLCTFFFTTNRAEGGSGRLLHVLKVA